jgi:hypothetical protein
MVLLSVSDLFWLGKLVKKGWRQGERGEAVWLVVLMVGHGPGFFFLKSLVHFFFIFWFKRAGREGECFVLFNFFML